MLEIIPFCAVLSMTEFKYTCEIWHLCVSLSVCVCVCGLNFGVSSFVVFGCAHHIFRANTHTFEWCRIPCSDQQHQPRKMYEKKIPTKAGIFCSISNENFIDVQIDVDFQFENRKKETRTFLPNQNRTSQRNFGSVSMAHCENSMLRCWMLFFFPQSIENILNS